MTDLVFYLFVFLAVGVFFLFIHLMIGKFIRPYRPDAEKMTIYECGEPTVGSAWIQFDLRYYVVALLFVVFDVEVAFFFPWAIVFGKANDLSRPQTQEYRIAATNELVPAELNLVYLERDPAPKKEGAAVEGKGGGKGEGKAVQAKGSAIVDAPKLAKSKGDPGSAGGPLTRRRPDDVKPIAADVAKSWAWIAFVDIVVFFGVLMVGFAYLWRRGDIDWVRSTAAEAEPIPAVSPPTAVGGSALAGSALGGPGE